MKHRPASRFGRVSAWLNADRGRKRAATALSLLALCLGVALTLHAVLPPRLPDLGAPEEDLIVFLAHHSDRIASADRDRLMDSLARRYFEADAGQRAEIERMWRDRGLDQAAQRRIKSQMDFALAYHLAEQYQQLTPEQRGPFLDRILVMVNTMGGGKQFLDWVAANPAPEVFSDPVNAMHNAGPFQRKLIYGTNAEQRAVLPQLGRDLTARAKRYQ